MRSSNLTVGAVVNAPNLHVSPSPGATTARTRPSGRPSGTTSPSCSSPAALERSPDPSGRWRADTRPSRERQRMVRSVVAGPPPVGVTVAASASVCGRDPPGQSHRMGYYAGTILAPLVLPFFAIA